MSCQVNINFTQLALTAGWNSKLFSDETGHGVGWAVGELDLAHDGTILAKCSSSFFLDSDLALRLADVYGENRSVHVLLLRKGRHRVFVKAGEPGWVENSGF
ncbi:MNS1 [Symbiodinium pilosum]|uniref:MNS1 protein n=1 Tax=Symbiodinium pilosum TaxID=2952 RepID=A0A812W6K5_SYMPI|nr:MNS1 [Symbiodinium pilosum]